MLQLGVSPDEVVFNNLLSGCTVENNIKLAKHIYQEMVERRVKPSNATFSIFIRLYTQSKLFEDAIEMLRTEPEARGLAVEQRLYAQLAQTCLRDRQGRRAIEVYKLLLTQWKPNAVTHGALLGMCTRVNMLDTAVEILSLAADSQGRVDAHDALQLR